MPNSGPEWTTYANWTRRVRIDLPAPREYAHSVYRASDEYLAHLPDADLAQPMDLSFVGLGDQTLGVMLSVLVL
jgi:hypothetical protein